MDCESILLPSLCQPDMVSCNADPYHVCWRLLVLEVLRMLHRVPYRNMQSSVVQNSRNWMKVCTLLPSLYASYQSMFSGKEVGTKMTLKNLLTTQSADLSTQFKGLLPEEKDALLSNYLQEKENKANVPKRASSAAIAKAVYLRIDLITTTVCVCITSLTCFWPISRAGTLIGSLELKFSFSLAAAPSVTNIIVALLQQKEL